MKPLDITGIKYGKLTAIRLIQVGVPHNPRDSNHRWLFNCDCGKETVTIKSRVINGETRSCGCLKRERMLIWNRRYRSKIPKVVHVPVV